ncbi:MAG TPA: M56 family metallopeptidase [Thermoanaerobaculia bacterium]|nr:M56 family metallopeptidase [Thermoanaerobaculia bacterium]
MIERFFTEHAGAIATHVVVSTLVLLAATAAATWIRPLTARTRHAILVAGMFALLLPPALFATLIERIASERATVIANALPRFGGMPIAVAVQQPVRVGWIPIAALAWLAIAVLLFLRWWLTSRRLVANALRVATPPPPRVIEALDAARRRVGVNTSIDIIASPLCEAPAVVRVVRPLIVLPADGCSVLDDEELQSLLCHECAHVARRDNLTGVAEAVICSLFWFNPFVWLAHRRIAAAREEACDELVADSAARAETYVGALAKFCRSLIAPRVPAVSCMASAHLKERIQHLMRYDTLRKSAFPHRITSITAVAAVVLMVFAAGIVTATPKQNGNPASRFILNYSVAKTDDGTLTVRTKIVERETGETFGEPAIVTKLGVPASTELARESMRMKLTLVPDTAGGGRIELSAYDGDELVQMTNHPLLPERVKRQPKYTGAPISLTLKDAEIHDVLDTFAKLTGLTITTSEDVQGVVTIDYKDVPWDEALDRMLRENGYTWVLEGSTMRVSRP